MQLRSICIFQRLIAAGFIAFALPALAGDIDPEQVWSAGGGSMTLEIRGDYLPDFGIEILHHGRPVTDRERIDFHVSEIEPMRLHAPRGNFEGLQHDRGRLATETGLTFRLGGRSVSLDRIFLVPGEGAGHPHLVAIDAGGNELFRITHMHLLTHPHDALLTIANAEVVASPHLAERLGLEALKNMPIAIAWLDLDLDVPAGARTDGGYLAARGRPIWPQDGEFEADVTLIDMGTVAYQGTQSGTGLVKTAPSATLRNESLADVPWIAQFTGHAQYPYTPPDQHPFLVWNIYRIEANRVRMLAASGVKHAFLTININCDINPGDGHILGPGCEDVYSSGNNDSSTHLGPREEIEASTGVWDNCNSFFDPNCTGSQTNYAGQWLNRLLIDPAEFNAVRGGTLYMDAWYVIQHDINIWNSMGFRPINPVPSGSGWSMNPGPYKQGPVIAEWVGENDPDPMNHHAVIVVPSETPEADYPDNMPQGHLRLLVKVIEQPGGRYRYNYALQNYDFDRALEGLRIDLPEGVTVHDTWFGDIDSDGDNDWSISVSDDHILFEAPTDNPLTWFTLFNFEIEVSTPPVESEILLDLGSDAVTPELAVTTLGPAEMMGLLFRDRFEDAGN